MAGRISDHHRASAYEALAAYSKALDVSTREQVPVETAITAGNIYRTLRLLQERTPKTKKREQVPFDVDMTLDDIYRTLQLLQERTPKTNRTGR